MIQTAPLPEFAEKYLPANIKLRYKEVVLSPFGWPVLK
jgi:hypothetical protein